VGIEIAQLCAGWFKSTSILSSGVIVAQDRNPPGGNYMKLKILILALFLGASCLWAQEKKEATPPAEPAPAVAHPATITADDIARKNPVKFTDVSVDRGKKIFGTQCALCHGNKGDGKGELAADMKLTVPDFTNADTLKNRTDGELFAVIGAGKDTMPAQGGRLSEVHRWNLVNYMRSLSGKVPEKSNGKEPDENIITVPQ
jgi:mono/diheme cytochrome c family protein